MKMPFGAHKGEEVDQLPRDYLYWLAGNVDLKGPLKYAVYSALDMEPLISQIQQLEDERKRLIDSNVSMREKLNACEQKLGKAYSDLAIKYRNNDPSAMQVVNEVFDAIRGA